MEMLTAHFEQHRTDRDRSTTLTDRQVDKCKISQCSCTLVSPLAYEHAGRYRKTSARVMLDCAALGHQNKEDLKKIYLTEFWKLWNLLTFCKTFGTFCRYEVERHLDMAISLPRCRLVDRYCLFMDPLVYLEEGRKAVR